MTLEQRRNLVEIRSWRCSKLFSTLFQRQVPAGLGLAVLREIEPVHSLVYFDFFLNLSIA